MLAFLVCSLLIAGDPPVLKPDSKAVVLEFSTDKPDDLQAALANHPDVQIAEAEVRIAQAKLAKVKLAVAQQVTAIKAKIAQARRMVEVQEQTLVKRREAVAAKTLAPSALELEEANLSRDKAALAEAEAELKAATGTAPPADGPKPVVLDFAPVDGLRNPYRGRDLAPPTGPAADKLRAALDSKWALDLPEDATLSAVCDAIAGAFGAHGLTVRAPGNNLNAGGPFKGERPVGQWLQLVADSVTVRVNAAQPPRGTPRPGRYDFYVRDYGLLFAPAGEAPPGAETVTQFMARTDRPLADRAQLSPAVQKKVRELMAKVIKMEPNQTHTASVTWLNKLTDGSGLTIQFPGTGDIEGSDLAGGERTVAAWLDQFRDSWAPKLSKAGPFQFYVREYGLILCFASEAPPGAVPLTELMAMPQG